MAKNGDDGPEWIEVKKGIIPHGAVFAGLFDKEKTYVARIKIEDENTWVPGQVFRDKGKCYGIWKREIINTKTYEVLCNCKPIWLKMRKDSQIPHKALKLNDSHDGFFIGRVSINDNTCIGQISEAKEKFYAHANTFKNIFNYEDYEILKLPQNDIDELKRKDDIKKSMLKSTLRKLKNISNPFTTKSQQKSPWVDAYDGTVPKGAVVGGKNHKGDIYVARIIAQNKHTHQNEVFLGKLIPSYQKCFVSMNGKELSSKDYQVLCNVTIRWESVKTGDPVPRSIFRCPSFRGNEIGVARVHLGPNSIVPGKVALKDGKCGKCYILLNSKEEVHEKYELLISDKYAHTPRHQGHSSDSESNVISEDDSSPSQRHNRQHSSSDSDNDPHKRKSSNHHTQKKNESSESEAEDKLQRSSKARQSKLREKSPKSNNSHNAMGGGNVRYRPTSVSKTVTSDKSWIDCQDGKYPQNAVVGGKNHVGPIYVARLYHKNELLPGKLIPKYRYCYSTSNGKEVRNAVYQVLCKKGVSWIAMTSGDKIPNNVLHAGSSYKKESLFVGRVIIDGTSYIGKVQDSDRCCYITKQQEEIRYKKFEILVEILTSSENNVVRQASSYLTSYSAISKKPSLFATYDQDSGDESNERQAESTKFIPIGFDSNASPERIAKQDRIQSNLITNSLSSLKIEAALPPTNHEKIQDVSSAAFNNQWTVKKEQTETATSLIKQPASIIASQQSSLFYLNSPSSQQRAETSSSHSGQDEVWISASNGFIPPGAVPISTNNHKNFLARVKHMNCLLPGVLVARSGCYVDFNGRTLFEKDYYEVLCMEHTEWISMNAKEEIPESAIACGYDKFGQTLYFGRVHDKKNDRTVIIGKVEDLSSKCVIFYNEETIYPENFDILIQNKSPPVHQKSSTENLVDLDANINQIKHEALKKSSKSTAYHLNPIGHGDDPHDSSPESMDVDN